MDCKRTCVNQSELVPPGAPILSTSSTLDIRSDCIFCETLGSRGTGISDLLFTTEQSSPRRTTDKVFFSMITAEITRKW